MDDPSQSLNSSMAKVASDEESGWTSYFEDFSSNTNSSCFSSSSLVSDAASCAACKFSHHRVNHHLHRSSFSSNNGVSPNLSDMKLSFKKTRTKQISEDDPLEDTATSPLSSPKVGELNPTEMISRKKADQLYDDSLGKGFTSEHNSEVKRDDDDQNKDEKNFNGKNNIDYTDLKKQGLCLVPLCMLVNYFG